MSKLASAIQQIRSRRKLLKRSTGHRFEELTYANENHPSWKRFLIRRVEMASGRGYLAGKYDYWRTAAKLAPDTSMTLMLKMLGMSLNIRGSLPDTADMEGKPLVMIANHPFGIGDGVAVLSLAERMNRPFKILINNELLKVPEIRPYALPVSFEETREALAINLETRRQALKLLAEGTIIIIFPSGGVATAKSGFGKAEDLPWKRFAARLVQSSKASVLPIFFEGQCSRIFHLASRISPTLRTALLIREFRRLVGKEIRAHIGEVIDGQELSAIRCRDELTARLYNEVFSLAESESNNQQPGRIKPCDMGSFPEDNRIAA